MDKDKIKKIALKQLTFKMILLLDDNWENYKKKYKVREVEKQEVEKMLVCMDPENGGYTRYMCCGCGEDKIIAHSCKSRICSVCGKRHTDEWSEEISKELYGVTYRHITMTVPDTLWPYLEGKANLHKKVLEAAIKTIKKLLKEYNRKRLKIEPGIIAVLHTFGKDLKTNVHVHMMVTEGGIASNGKWIDVPFIGYEAIRNKWKYEVTKALEKETKDKKLIKEIKRCRNKYKGFTIRADRRIKGNKKSVMSYMARYIRHPAISDARIIGYNKRQVKFYYDDEKGIKRYVIMDKYEFIHSVIKHIPDKNFKMVRRFGIHSRVMKKTAYKIMKEQGLTAKYTGRKFSWRRNKMKFEGKDPLKCSKCGEEMEVYEIVNINKKGERKSYGGFDYFIRNITRGVVNEEKEKKEEKLQKNKTAEFELKYSQICMF